MQSSLIINSVVQAYKQLCTRSDDLRLRKTTGQLEKKKARCQEWVNRLSISITRSNDKTAFQHRTEKNVGRIQSKCEQHRENGSGAVAHCIFQQQHVVAIKLENSNHALGLDISNSERHMKHTHMQKHPTRQFCRKILHPRKR